ncbi:MAG: TRAP transporter small permease [bacterium]
MFEKTKKVVLKIEGSIASIEKTALIIGLIVMVVAGTMQVLLRNFFNTGLEWADMLARSLVLWVGFIGASLATRRSKHINIEVISKLVTNAKFSKIRALYVNIVSFVITSILAWASIQFIIIEAKDGMTAFLHIPTWVIFIIVPISLVLISIRFFLEIFVGRIEEETV